MVHMEKYEVKETPVRMDRTALNKYTGQYGDRTIALDNEGFLYIQRPGGLRLRMLHKEKDAFKLYIMPIASVVFMRGEENSIIGLKVSKGDGKWEYAQRD